MRNSRPLLSLHLFCLAFILLSALLITPMFGQGLEDVIIEEYYVTDGSEGLPEGLTTYRVFVDMAPGYEAQIIFGFTTPETIDDNLGNVIEFATTTQFYNSQFGSTFGEGVNPALFSVFPTSALDTYISMGAGANGRIGIPKTDDTNGSVLSTFTNIPSDGISPSVSDGLIAGATSTTGTLGLETTPLAFNGVGNLFSYDGNWFNLNGVSGPNEDNKVLIGQFTTDGEFSFQFSIQILLPGGPGSGAEVYSPVNAILPTGQVTTIFPALKYPPETPVLGCTSGTACNFNPVANINDGSCIEPVENCLSCADGGTIIIDSDGDGICNADEISGCTSITACNYNSAATDENFTCLEPEINCLECNNTNSGLILIDTDGDNICDANEIAGCTSMVACNYNSAATDDDGSCLIAVENCTSCNFNNTDLILIDDDGDGVCNAEEILGCTDEEAANYDPLATEENGSCTYIVVPGCTNVDASNFDPGATANDGSCIIPQVNCTTCNETGAALIIVDSDGDGICDAEEINGCTNKLACNYNPDATEEDNTCIVPVDNCLECNLNNDGFIIIDSDGDGICDSEEILGCTNSESCNFNFEATEDDGNCLIPVDDCYLCNSDNTELIIIDTDNDGICDVEEILGCTNPDAQNYNPEATEDDGSCLFVGLSDNVFSAQIQVFPNPVSDVLNIKLSDNSQLFAGDKIEILSTSGKLLLLEVISRESSAMQININTLSSGYYYLIISTKEARGVVSFIKF